MLLDETEVRIHQLAVQIADEAARSDIEIQCPCFTEEGREPATLKEIPLAWYDTRNVPSSAVEVVRMAIAYLELRGKIVRHPFREGWVQVRN